MSLGDRFSAQCTKANQPNKTEFMSLGDRFLVQSKTSEWPKNNEFMLVSLLCGNNINILQSQSIPICQNICDFRPPFHHPHPRTFSTPKRLALQRRFARAKVYASSVLRLFVCF